MFTPALSFPAPAYCQIEQWSREAEQITVTLRSQQTTSLCPCCGQAGSRIQSHYHRQLADLGIVKLTKIRLEIGGKVGNFSYQ